MGKMTVGIIFTLMVLGLLPFALIARSRSSQSDALPPHLVLDMDKQPKFRPQRATPMFADQRAMRPQVAGTVAQEDLIINSERLNDPENPRMIGGMAGTNVSMRVTDAASYAALTLGRVRPANMTDAQFAAVIPPTKDDAIANDTTFYVKQIPSQIAVSAELLKRGQERFNIYCAPCHGESGYGDGPVAQRATRLTFASDAISGWVNPQNLHEAKISSRPDGHLFNTITNGVRTMPAYEKQITVPDRWAIIAYVRALQASQNAGLAPATAPAATRPASAPSR